MAEYEIEMTCRTCGKKIAVLAPSRWAYKKRSRKNGAYEYYCSWKCIQKSRENEKKPKLDYDPEDGIEEEDMAKELTQTQKEAVNIAMKGGDPLKFLKEHGQKNPSAAWLYIKRKLAEVDPQKTLELMNKQNKQQIEKNEQKQKQEPVEKNDDIQAIANQIEKAAEELAKPMGYAGFTVTAVNGECGEYRIEDNRIFKFVRIQGISEMAIHKDDVKKWLEEMKQAAKILGVEV